MLWPCQWDAIFFTLLLFWCQFSVLLTCQKVKLWMLWESICFSVIRIGCKHFWEVWLKFEHIYQIRLSKIQCNAAAGSFKYGLSLGCYNFSFFVCECIGNRQEKNLPKFQRIVSLQFWRNLRGEECSISPARQAAATEAFEKNWKSTLLILVSRFHVIFGFSFVLWFPNSFGVMLLMFHFLSTMWALILSFTFSVSKNPFELDWLWKNLWVGREVASQ